MYNDKYMTFTMNKNLAMFLQPTVILAKCRYIIMDYGTFPHEFESRIVPTHLKELFFKSVKYKRNERTRAYLIRAVKENQMYAAEDHPY